MQFYFSLKLAVDDDDEWVLLTLTLRTRFCDQEFRKEVKTTFNLHLAKIKRKYVLLN